MPLQEPFEMPDGLEQIIDEYLGHKALAIQKGEPLGVWIVGMNQENNAKPCK